MTHQKQNILYNIYLILISATICLVFSQSPIMPFYNYDSSVYQYIGKLILEGHTPYRDVFDHKGPIVYFWHALGYFINPMTGQYYLETIIIYFSMLFGFNIIKKQLKTPPLISFFIVSIVFSLTPHFDTIGNTETLTLIPIYYSIYFYLNYQQKKKLTFIKCFLFGLSCSSFLLIKPLNIVIPFLLGIAILINAIKDKLFLKLIPIILKSFIGLFTLLSITLYYLYKNDALIPFYEDYILFNIEYSKLNQKPHLIYNTLCYFIKHSTILISLASIIYLIPNYKKYSKTELSIIATISLTFLITFIVIILPGNEYSHYLLVLSPLTTILLSIVVKSISLKTINKPLYLNTLIILFFITPKFFLNIISFENLLLISLFFTGLIFLRYCTYHTLSKKENISLNILFTITFISNYAYQLIPFFLISSITYTLYKNKHFHELKNTLNNFIIYFISPITIISITLYFTNNFNLFYESSFIYNILYANHIHNLSKIFILFIKQPIILFTIFFAIYLSLHLNKYTNNEKFIIKNTINCFIITSILIIFIISNRYTIIINYNILTLYPIILTLLFFAFKKFNLKKQLISIAILTLTICLLNTVQKVKPLKYTSKQLKNDPIITLLDKNTKPNEPFLFLGGNQAFFHLYSNRNSSSKYALNQCLVNIYPLKLLEDIRKKQPLIIVLQKSSKEKYDYLKIEKNYEIKDQDNSYILFKRKPSPK